MADQRYIKFIEYIISLTKQAEISWKYLDSNKALYESMHWVTEGEEKWSLLGNRTVLYPEFNREESFYVGINDANVVLLVRNSEPASMYVVPYTYKKVVQLDADEYGEYITRLHNLVESQFPDGETFIDNLLAQNDEADNNQHG